MPKPGIHEVAARAQVSPTAVSFALNGRGKISVATRQRILKAAEELGYRPHHAARSLKTGRSMAVGLQASGDGSGAVVPRDASSAFYIEALNGAAAEALALEHLLVVVPGTAPRSEDYRGLPVDAVVVMDPVGRQRLAESTRGDSKPVVSIGHHIGTPDLFDMVVDNDFGAVIATGIEHLVAQGYKRPALILAPSKASYSQDLVRAYKTWCHDQRRRPIVAKMAAQNYSAAKSAALDLLGASRTVRPDCIIAVSDETGLGVLQAAHALGLPVPNSLGLVTITSTEPTLASQLASPSMTLIDLHAEQLGRKAIRAAVSLLQSTLSDTDDHEVVEHSLIVGRSTARDG